MTNFSGDNESVQQPTQSSLCEKNCGFFANPACMGMCSKCYRDNQHKEEASKKAAENVAEAMEAKVAKPVAVPVVFTPPPVPVLEASPAAVTSASEASSSQDGAPPAKTPTRCRECRKKVGLTGFKCRCGMLFCGQHRYAEAHNCTFDYKTVERQRLAENNPLVQASKVQKL